MEKAEEEKTKRDYARLFELIDDLLLKARDDEDIGTGVAAVVMARFSASICHHHAGMDIDQFTEFARQHYKMMNGKQLPPNVFPIRPDMESN